MKPFLQTPLWGFMAVFLLVISLSVSALSCGAKAKPSPEKPEGASIKLPSVEGAKAIGRAGKITITWKAVESDKEDERPVGFRVYRKQSAGEGGGAAEDSTLLMGDIEAPGENMPKKLAFYDDYLEEGAVFEYHIFAYNSANKLGGDTVLGPFKAEFPKEKVADFKVETPNGQANLSWKAFGPVEAGKEPPPEAEGDKPADKGAQDKKAEAPEGDGAVTAVVESPAKAEDAPAKTPEEAKPSPAYELFVNLYRAEGEEGPFSPDAINPEPLKEASFIDGGAPIGRLVRYLARSVRIENGVFLEGPSADELKVKVIDETPPGAPVVLWVKALDGGVRVRWTPVKDPDIFGYHLERRVKDEPPESFKDISGFITVDEFTDRSVVDNSTYIYRAVARDRAGNRAFSDEQELVYPPPKEEEAEAAKEGETEEEAAPAPSEEAPPEEPPAPAEPKNAPVETKPPDSPKTDGAPGPVSPT